MSEMIFAILLFGIGLATGLFGHTRVVPVADITKAQQQCVTNNGIKELRIIGRTSEVVCINGGQFIIKE